MKSEACGGVSGDNDPLDVVEIGGKAHATGEIVRVKPLGVYAMIDDGELDWKVRPALRRFSLGRGVSRPLVCRPSRVWLLAAGLMLRARNIND